MFVDTAKVLISAGKGGDGAVSFRHEIYVEKGGPDGGDGGKGGDVVFKAVSGLNTLVDFRYKPELKAKPGTNGSKRDRHGADGETLEIKVPMGTIVLREGEIIADLVENGQKIAIAKGGDGGFGNAHFKSSVRQTPRIAEKGEPGESFEAMLELKLLADVGLVGFPNVGKSTFLSVVSNARPEIADYPFTTLSPNLGVADIDNTSLLIADIPGLIEGASEGKGLGDAFLRHVERTAVLLHLIDAYTDDIAGAYQTIRLELTNYKIDLKDRPEIIALTKTEGLDDDIIQMQIDAVKAVAGKTPVFAISSIAHKGLTELLRALCKKVEQSRELPDATDKANEEIETISLGKAKIADAWDVERIEDREDDVIFFKVTGEKVEKFARRTDFDNFEGVNRLRDILKKLGIAHELRRQGAEGDSIIQIGDNKFTLQE
ncbi:MAG TPA: GTPase ObgE [Candidatus Saccharimonadales bacterium]|nr:GTPase ObgE [Candidatus Saccharimonadales bacterium]